MPRTKAPKKKISTIKEDNVNNNVEEIDKVLKKLAITKKEYVKDVELECKELLSKCSDFFEEQIAEIPINMLNKTISQIRNNSSSTTLFTSCVNASLNPLLSSTKNTTVKTRNALARSQSFVDDEGYLTSESKRGTSGTRQSRRQQTRNSNRVSRSLSRSNMQKTSTVKRNIKTPINRAPPTTYGTVTPKVKPNVPQVLLRRPKQGEMALSLQGSPLFTGSVVSETIANVNIPLSDGRLLSIQPERGLRLSQIPHLDLETKQQLETLRDNLNKVCAINARH